MTKEKILEFFKDINSAYNNCNMLDILSNMLDELLKERKPRKVKNIRNVTNICFYGDCPSCGGRIYNTLNPNFCGRCGERIDWEDGETE